MTKKLLVMAGGTGGHVFPGLAVAQELSAQGWDIHWLGTSQRMEASLVPKFGFPISFIDVVGVRNNGLARLLMAPFKIVKSIWQAHKVIKAFQPNVVIGLGGFASGPGGVAAWCNGLPLVLHEQNAAPGLTNRLLAKIATRVLTGFANTFADQELAKSKYTWVGNPVRAEFSNLAEKTKLDMPLNLLVVGGSLGAKVLNDTVPLALQGLTNIKVRHQTGKGHLAAVQQSYKANVEDPSLYQISEFIDDMAQAYEWADLVVCRAGALTVAEVAAAGVAAVFVPLPHAVDDHQTKNAQVLADSNAAYLMPQKDLSPDSLHLLLKSSLDLPKTLLDMGKNAKALARLDAAKKVAHFCIELSEQAA
ncbi:undecaprenyldiphospho-muramoylpentapeptide beta-N-acetylglucosaminyltransferase [Paraglaciecola sp. 2405UD69-4]|uniref:undecaprenyldiphospho-muramoylpentapeptide beta-N-acetylglucosaminyltransferase n=1 Tax=Paraglaciecola sp. 2405UD69-4 TaxID=3391836 RepID=UPI0039C95D00